MLTLEEVKKLTAELQVNQTLKRSDVGSEFTVRLVDEASKLSITIPVYKGQEFIPISVRQSVHKPSPFKSATVRTYLSIDEDRFQISLNYLGRFQPGQPENFHQVLSEFLDQAEKWRVKLDEHDRNDLVHVRQKR